MNSEDLLYKKIGKLIRTQRLKEKLTQNNLATKVGLTRTSITNIENGSQRIQLHDLYSIANVLNVPLHILLPEQEVHTINTEKSLPRELKPKERKWIQGLILEQRREKQHENKKKDGDKKLSKIASAKS